MTVESEEFYNLMQQYRWAADRVPLHSGLPTASEAYQAVIEYIEKYKNGETP